MAYTLWRINDKLCKEKQGDKTMSGVSIAGKTAVDLANEIRRVASELGKNPANVTALDITMAGNFNRTQIDRLGGITRIKNAYLSQELDEGEIMGLQIVRREINAGRKERGSFEYMMNHIEKVVKDTKQVIIDKTIIKLLEKKPKQTKYFDKATWSDWHTGANLGTEGTAPYGVVEEARAVSSLVKKTCQYKLEHRQETELIIEILGDMIQGDLHPGGICAPLHEQTLRCFYLLLSALSIVSSQFKKVRVYFGVGNHARDLSVHGKGRATSQKWNSYEMSIYGMLKQAMKPFKNVVFHLDDKPFFTYKLFNHSYYGAHGDTNMSIGSIGSSVNTKAIEGMTSRINAQRPDGDKIDVFTLGHLHQSLVLSLPTGAKVIANSTICPPDPYAGTLGISTPRQEQTIVEVTPEYPVGDILFLDVTGSDKDKSLDKIIKPWDGING